MFYCDFEDAFGDKKAFVQYPVLVFMLFVFMYNMSSTADEYLSPALEHMTVKFNIPESLAGVTLLAFGNGAPDCFSAMSAGDDNAINSMSPLFGSALFISTCVIALATRAAKDGKIKVTSTFFIRDLIVFILMELYLLVILFFIGEVTYLVAFSFVIIYLCYVGLVVYHASQSKGADDGDDDSKRLMIDANDLIQTSSAYKKAKGNYGSVANLEDFI